MKTTFEKSEYGYVLQARLDFLQSDTGKDYKICQEGKSYYITDGFCKSFIKKDFSVIVIENGIITHKELTTEILAECRISAIGFVHESERYAIVKTYLENKSTKEAQIAALEAAIKSIQ